MGAKEMTNTNIPIISATKRIAPPGWAIKQRNLIDMMNEAAVQFVDKYTRPDGTLIWRNVWPGMDGSDDAYEGFLSFPLLYLLGGSDYLHETARRLWSSITRQFTEYGQVYREYDRYYDWMHHGESSTYLYYLGLCDPNHEVDRERALKFADMYTGADPEAENWDPVHKMIRSPINGSAGPRLEMTAEDWVTHRRVLANVLPPYEDVPGVTAKNHEVPLDWKDDTIFAGILELMNRRMVPGDVPLNLVSTSLVTNAYLYGREERYKNWVIAYLEAWKARTENNGGIMPDNIGPGGIVGELMDGKWWGGYYGWRWPHGSPIILESTLIAGSNAAMLSGDTSSLDLHRSQWDLLWSLRTKLDGEWLVPSRHGDAGWFDYRPSNPKFPAFLWYMSRDPSDLERLRQSFPDRAGLYEGAGSFFKAGKYPAERWMGYMMGENPEYPDKVLEDTYIEIARRMERTDADNISEAGEWNVHHWQGRNPVVPEGLIQMAMGTPGAVYHGGLLHATVRYFDAEKKRPGLPQGVAALVDKIDEYGTSLILVNTDPIAGKSLIVQAGAFGEHSFSSVKVDENEQYSVGASHFQVNLGPFTQLHLHAAMDRFSGRPGYNFPSFR
jgi:hypothetical protein